MRNTNFNSGPLGYISQVDGGSATQPLYRCSRLNASGVSDHFYTHDIGCEGSGNREGLVGYTFNGI